MQTPQEHQLLGTGRGIDHFIIAVRDLEKVAQQYQATLGFSVSGSGKHPGGTENRIARFRNDSYLELLSYYDPEKASDLASFLHKHEGADGLGIHVSSAEKTAAFLKARGFQISEGAGTIKLEGVTVTPPVLWRWVAFEDKAPPYSLIFFIEYTKEREELRKNHPEHYPANPQHHNTAVKVSSAWMAVKDLEDVGSKFESMGFRSKRRGSLSHLSADYQEIEAGEGTILLLEPRDSSGEIGSFLRERGEALCGLSIQVENSKAVQEIVEGTSNERVSRNTGIYGPSVMLSPRLTHGVWMEFYQSAP